MKSFLTACTGCHIDAVAMHWYDAAWNTGYFTNYFTGETALSDFASFLAYSWLSQTLSSPSRPSQSGSPSSEGLALLRSKSSSSRLSFLGCASLPFFPRRCSPAKPSLCRNKQPKIERYAIFGNYEGAAAEGNLITNGRLNEVGTAYRDAA